eukprot:11460360-Prorocentrum_lima.AAC.1
MGGPIPQQQQPAPPPPVAPSQSPAAPMAGPSSAAPAAPAAPGGGGSRPRSQSRGREAFDRWQRRGAVGSALAASLGLPPRSAHEEQ